MSNTKKESNPEKKKQKKKGRARPGIAIAGFFVMLFLFALLAYLFQKMWLTGLGAFLAIAWAVFFSYEPSEYEEVWERNPSQTEKEEESE